MVGHKKNIRGTRIALLACAAILLSSYEADAKKRKTPSVDEIVESGSSWWCSSEICRRDQEECENKIPEYDDGDCAQQAKSAVFTAFSVMNDNYVYWSTPSSRQCKAIRKAVIKDDDYSVASACTIVGAVAHPRIATPWWWSSPQYSSARSLYCSYSGECVFERDECEDSTVCFPQASVYSYAAKRDRPVVAGEALVRWFGSKKQCEFIRLSHSYVDSVSECDELRPKPVSADVYIVPAGSEWSCHDVESAATMEYGNCYRTVEDCQGAQTTFAETDCLVKKKAWAYTTDGEWFAFSTEASCNSAALLVGGRTTSSCARI